MSELELSGSTGGLGLLRAGETAGETVEPPRANRGRLGHLIVTGPDAESVERQTERLLAQIRIKGSAML